MNGDRFFAGLWCKQCRLSPGQCTCTKPVPRQPKRAKACSGAQSSYESDPHNSYLIPEGDQSK